jgi:hypothetical protein
MAIGNETVVLRADTQETIPLKEIPVDENLNLIVAASTVGTIIEWYDFFVYGINNS